VTVFQILQKLQTDFPVLVWAKSPNLDFGLLATNYAFLEAKKLKQNPQQIAKDLTQNLNNWVEKNNLEIIFQAAGPYINLNLKSSLWQKYLDNQNLNQFELNQIDQKVIVDFCSVNVAKPLHAGHLRNIDIGESLVRILKLKYTTVKTENYWGDWGVQFGIMLWAWKIFEDKKSLKLTVNGKAEELKIENYKIDPIQTLVKVYIWGNQQKENVENWDKLVRDEFLKLEKGDPQNRQIWQDFVSSTRESIYPYLEELGVKRHDYEFGESYYEGRMKELTSFFEENNLWEKEAESRYFDFEKLAENWTNLDPNLKPKITRLGRCYLISSSGYTSYAYRDITARIHWAGELDMDIMITVTANEQNHHFAQLFAICYYLSGLPVFQEKFGNRISSRLNYNNLVHINYGFLTLPEGKMSTRSGNFLTAKDLVNKVTDQAYKTLQEKANSDQNLIQKSKVVAIAALKWYDLARDSGADIVLDISKILSFEGNTGVYQLYTIARLNSILRKNPTSDLNLNYDLLNPVEQKIIKACWLTPLILDQISDSYKPHHLCNHLFEIATMVNSWYAETSVSKETDENRKQTLLNFCQQIQLHLKQGLGLLGIESLAEL
jgi:arginyl-tRNA synthetase